MKETTLDALLAEIDVFLEENRGMTFLLNYCKTEGWMCEFGIARHTELIAEFQGFPPVIIKNAFDHAQKFIEEYPDFYCSKTMRSQGVREWKVF